jgi:predicted enzyme involved in methoxymalonyl-ACP biosynthesis
MSCRVIKRGLEYAMFDELVKACLRKSITTIKGYYIKTAKNVMVATHYREMGFQLLTQLESGDSEWQYTIPADYIPKANIKVVNE